MNNPIYNFINLHDGEQDKQVVLDNVTLNTSFRGSNLWILACAILIASVGLNVNSTAVIIGAMLISPLMGPIVGAGFALGTYNFALLKKSMKNLLIATVVSLLVSCVYFYISPFKDVQSELLARTAPNIYDVLIAFFGGLVGVIASTRVEKGNPIPGVAIATALMPPLCTAGYGLATFNFSFFFGAFYLYTINCFFICIATFLLVKYLKYPSSIVDEKYRKRIRYGITALIMVMIIPSCYLAYTLWNQKKFNKTVEEFIDNEFTSRGYTVIYKKINYHSRPKEIEIAFLNRKLSDQEIKTYNKLLGEKGVEAKLHIRQDDTDLKSEILSEVNKRNASISEKDLTINSLRQELDRYKVNDRSLIREMGILFPDLQDITLGKVERYPMTDSARINFLFLYSSQPKTDTTKLKAWLSERLQTKELILIRK
ncbi:DUF389 domain-containing protein [Nubsella zeaxanthinifaciens]|uniref:DUF389 domain-containing protein n=1 Tax=Nubsella zeaxanthinifaciens TaxID=392412 RepID=UPI000DE3AD26|nr:DUF389 domain-containing protein [Nubsella zeaxanthinifaciens]